MELWPQFVATVKNLRGVVYFRPGQEVGRELTWVGQRFRYRNLGVVPSLLAALGQGELAQRLGRDPFVPLAAPTATIARLVEGLSVLTPAPVVESLLLASSYASPLLILGRSSLKDLGPAIVHTLRTAQGLSDKEAKRHLRIADYAVLDFHRQITQEALEGLHRAALAYREGQVAQGQGLLDRLLRQRERLAREDCQTRFWRLTPEGQPEGRELIFYLDPIRLMFPTLGPDNPSPPVAQLLLEAPPDLALALDLLVGFLVEKGEGTV